MTTRRAALDRLRLAARQAQAEHYAVAAAAAYEAGDRLLELAGQQARRAGDATHVDEVIGRVMGRDAT